MTVEIIAERDQYLEQVTLFLTLRNLVLNNTNYQKKALNFRQQFSVALNSLNCYNVY